MTQQNPPTKKTHFLTCQNLKTKVKKKSENKKKCETDESCAAQQITTSPLAVYIIETASSPKMMHITNDIVSLKHS